MKIPYKIGEIVLLSQPSSGNQDQVIYKSRIADLSSKYIAIEMPISEKDGNIAFFPEGNEVEVTYSVADGSQYIFSCTILGRKRERIPLTLITYPDEKSITRIQRRNFLRVPCRLDLAIHPVMKHEFIPFVTRTIDLSGGGLMFEGKNTPSLKADTEINWWLSIPTQSGQIIHPSGTGKILREISPPEKGLHSRFTVQFLQVMEKDREMIIKYCFERQLQIKQKMMED